MGNQNIFYASVVAVATETAFGHFGRSPEHDVVPIADFIDTCTIALAFGSLHAPRQHIINVVFPVSLLRNREQGGQCYPIDMPSRRPAG